MDSSGDSVPSSQMFPPDEVKYIYDLLATKEERQVNGTYPFAYSTETIENMVNDHIKNHPELTIGWSPLGKDSLKVYRNKYQQEIIKRLRTDDGVRMKNGRIKYTPRSQADPGASSLGGTRATDFGKSGRPDGSYQTAFGRAQNINDTNI